MKTLIIIVCLFAIVFIWDYVKGTDSTDKSRWKRSGMNLHVDHKTGCHYLSVPGIFSSGTLVPRLNSDGKHICDKKEN